MNEHRIPKRWVQPWVMRQVQGVIGARFDEIAPENTIRKVQCPVLLIHGADDRDVPVAEARRLMARAPNDSLKHLIPDTGHDLRPAMPLIAPRVIDFMRTLICDN